MACSSSSRITTWSLSQRTPRLTCSRISSRQSTAPRRSCRRCLRWGGSGRRRGSSSLPFCDGIAHVELVRADDVALRADAEQLALDGVEVVLRVDLLGEDRVQRLAQPLARGLAVDRDVLVAVGNPDVGDARRAERLAESPRRSCGRRCRARPRTCGCPRRGWTG